MAYPDDLDNFTNPATTDPISADHAEQHGNANDAIEELEAKVGVDSSAVTTSHDYKLSGVTGTEKALSNATGSVGGENLSTSSIYLDYQQITSNAASSGTGLTAVAGLVSTVTIPEGGRKVKITVFAGRFTNNGAGQYATLTIWDGAIGTGTQIALSQYDPSTNGYEVPVICMAVVTPAAGSKTYRVALTASAGGTTTLFADRYYPAFILVELM